MATLSESDSRTFVEERGIVVSAWGTARGPEEAAELATLIGLPVALKLSSENIVHKSERRFVRLNLTSVAEITQAGIDLLAAVEPQDGQVEILVTSMIEGNREFIAGLFFDDHFGPCVMLGIGGVLAEAFGDVAFRLAPLTKNEAFDLIDDLNYQTLLEEWRGEPAVNTTQLAETLLALSAMATEIGIQSVDLNPLIIANGQPVAVDVLVEVTEDFREQ